MSQRRGPFYGGVIVAAAVGLVGLGWGALLRGAFLESMQESLG
jgi:hypothetical protein